MLVLQNLLTEDTGVGSVTRLNKVWLWVLRGLASVALSLILHRNKKVVNEEPWELIVQDPIPIDQSQGEEDLICTLNLDQ